MAPDPLAEPPPGAGPGGVRTTKRRGRLGAEARRALAEVAPRWALTGSQPWTPRSLSASFGRRAPRLLDVGTGNGEATRAWAGEHPGWDVVAVELHRPGLARLVRDLDVAGPANVRIAEADAADVIGHRLEPGSLHAVRALFPDPWPKRRHRDRRLIDDALVRRLGDLLPAGGWLHVATDWAPYADQVRRALQADRRLEPEGGVDEGERHWPSRRPDRPITAYERRALAAGRPVTDLVAVRVNAP